MASARKRTEPQSSHRRPDAKSAPRCVWMDAGVLGYRLCASDYDCETCALHLVLSGRLRPEARGDDGTAAGDHLLPTEGPLGPGLAVPLRMRRGIHYHTTHLWGRQEASGRVRIGLDDLAARLVGGSDGWSLPVPGTHVSTGDRIGSVTVGDMQVQVSAPVPCRVVARNEALRRYPQLAVWSPYDAGWLLEVAMETEMSPTTGFMATMDVAARWFEAEAHRVEALAAAHLAEESEVGVTMADGGAPVRNLPELLGPQGFRAALRSIFPASRI